MLEIFQLLLLVSALPVIRVVDSAGIKIMGSVDHGRSHSQSELFHRKQSGNAPGRPGHQRFHSETMLAKMISENPGAVLYEMLMNQYNVDALPVNDTRQPVQVRLLLKLTQLVEVDEKNQIMTTNVWLRHEWFDSNLKWNPKQFGGIETLYIPCDEIWLPDTVLYNNADGDYQVTIQTKVEVRYDGLVVWEPPAIYKSFCLIDVEFFPYDNQTCEMKFGPWTFDVSKVDYFLMNTEGNISEHFDMAVDMSGFYESVEWDLLKINGSRVVRHYPCCDERYVDITYHFNIRRKTLFYTINLIIPCVMISFITVLVFYLPCQSGEKVAFSISNLLSLTWFILLLSEIIPPTSLSLPLMGKYLLFTMVLVTLSIILTVIVLYNHFRHPYAFAMPFWVRFVFLDVLPKLMFFQTVFNDQQLRNDYEKNEDDCREKQPEKSSNRMRYSRNSVIYTHLLRSSELDTDGDAMVLEQALNRKRGGGGAGSSSSASATPSPRSWHSSPFTGNNRRKNQNPVSNNDFIRMRYGALLSCHEEGEFIINEALPAIDRYMMIPEVKEAMKCIHYISSRYRAGNIDAKIKGDWEAVSRVLDRFFLIIFSAASTLGTMAILLRAPSLYDPTPALAASDPREIFPPTPESFEKHPEFLNAF